MTEGRNALREHTILRSMHAFADCVVQCSSLTQLVFGVLRGRYTLSCVQRNPVAMCTPAAQAFLAYGPA
eukprot:326070-Amphidinium_carterae.3